LNLKIKEHLSRQEI